VAGICESERGCVRACLGDGNCLAAGQPSCNEATGYCECTEDSCGEEQACEDGACVCTGNAGCSPLAGGTICVDGTCECAGDDDCVLPGKDVCVDGTCSCSADEACMGLEVHPGTVGVCR
jgi:hypothetical protein